MRSLESLGGSPSISASLFAGVRNDRVCYATFDDPQVSHSKNALMAAPLTVTPTEIPDVLFIQSRVFGDERGFFFEAFSEEAWRAEGLPTVFVQDSMSRSAKGTLRGLHYQIDPHAQGKFVRAARGSLFDVAVDIRRGSPTFGRWVGRTLRDDDGSGLWIPGGFAHGFLALEENTVMYYKCSAPYAPQAERSIVYNEPEIGIAWPAPALHISAKDAEAPRLADAEYNFVYEE